MAASTDQKPDARIGTRFGEGGRYEIRGRIGRGGMADVYKVADTQLSNRVFAVKILSVEDDESLPDARRREVAKLRSLFLEEAFALSRVRDSNVVTIFSNGRLPDAKQTPYMLMEYLDGTDVHRHLKKLAQKNELLPVERAAEIILGVCAGVQACHLAGIIHRDLKPANIFLEATAKGEVVKVLDFSIAKIPVSRDQTKTDFIVGTEDYMAPEQRDRKPATELSDQYSIGAIFYKCLTGESPRGLFGRMREKRPELPAALESAIFRAMNATPESRFASVHEFGQAIHPFATPEARARWKHYYTTPPLPIRPVLTGPIAPTAPARSRLGIPELIPGTRVEAYDFKVHDRTTSVAEDPSGPATTLDRDGVPSLIETPSFLSGPPTKDTAPPTELDPPNSHPLFVAPPPAHPPATRHSNAAAPSSASSVSSVRPAAGSRQRVAIVAVVVPLLVAGSLFARSVLRRPEVVPATAPAWTRTVLEATPEAPPAKGESAKSVAVPTAPATAPAAAAVAPSTQAAATPPSSAVEPGATKEVVPSEPKAATAAEGPKRTLERPLRRKRPKIEYDQDGLPLLH